MPSLEGMDPYDPICQAIIQNEKWTADLLGQEGRDFCNAMKIAHREIIGKTIVEFTHAWYQRDEKVPSVSEALAWRDRIIVQTLKLRRQFLYMDMYMFKDIKS